MKRSGPLQRRTPLRSRPPTRRGNRVAPRRRTKPGMEFWRTQRAALYERSGGHCERCGRSLDSLGLEAHHRMLRSQGGKHGLSNLTALCSADHRWVHAHPQQAQLLGYIVPSTGDPAARPMRLPDGRYVRLTDDGEYDVIFDEKGDPAA